MLKNMKFLFALLAFCCSFSFALDTLEVYAFLVDFKKEDPDNSLTTGDGTFNSKEAKKKYRLDADGRGNHDYWARHFEFAKAYYEAASNNQQTISWRIFPENGTVAYPLNKEMISYVRTSKRKSEKVAEYDDDRTRLYITFVHDAVKAANATSDSPFKTELPKNSNKKRAYMIIHAGASGLVDGGSLGTNGANTPGDFIDTYVTSAFWNYLPKDSVLKDTASIDTLRGMPLQNAAIDTLKEVMVVSETANQDGLNWGVNGIMVNQIGRALGMPNTFDGVKGISRLGYFDVMDFAGYNAGNGFLPVLPSAWQRAYMGWANVKTVSPKAGKKITVEIAAAGSNLGTEIVKVPLSANEYLLIENRQRTLNESGNVTVAYQNDAGEKKTKDIPVDSIGSIFKESSSFDISGTILSAKPFDLSLPASGIAVWKVNDWYLRDALQFGGTNFWNGDTVRDHQFGISLVEADGIVTIGKTFKNALGQDAYDYGSGTDLLPHLRFAKGKTFEPVLTVKPTGYGNTSTIQGGYTGVKVTASIPENARKEKTANAFMGDSVWNFASPKITVTIEFEDLALSESDFPKDVGLDNAARSAIILDYPSGSTREGEKMLVFGSENGTLQALSAFGEPLVDPDTIVKRKVIANKDSFVDVPLHILGNRNNGKLLGVASAGNNVYSLHEKMFVTTTVNGSLDQVTETVNAMKFNKALAGPVIFANSVWYIADGALRSKRLDGSSLASLGLPDFFKPHSFAACGGTENNIVLVGDNAVILEWSIDKKSGIKMINLPVSTKGLDPVKGQKFNVVCSDFDRDGVTEAFVLGNRGYGAFVKLSDTLRVANPPRQYKLNGDISRPIIADVNNDGYPEAIFLGDNKVYAVDYKGIAISGFPVTISKGISENNFNSEPLAVDVTGDKVPEILVPTNGGLLYAYTGTGKPVGGYFPMQAGTVELVQPGELQKPMSVYVGNAIDSVRGLELYAFHRNHVAAFRLPQSEALNTNWALPGNGNERTGYFDASVLKLPESTKDKAEITEFYMYPNPVRGGIAKSRFSIGANAKYAELEIFDITGLKVMEKKMGAPKKGVNQWDAIDLSKLGFDVYNVRLRVKFETGETKQKFYRIGVVQ